MRALVPFFLVFLLLTIPQRLAADPVTITFTAGEIKDVMANDYNNPLSTGTYLWGLWAIRAMPILSGGTYDILSGGVNDIASSSLWVYAEPDANVQWAYPYLTEVAYFHLQPASEHLDTGAHDLYFISNQPADSFQTYTFDNQTNNGYDRSTWVGLCDPAALAAGCNPTYVLSDAAQFTFTFSFTPGASLLGWQFLVDGSQYYLDGQQPADWATSSLWIQDFIGGDQWLPYDPFRQNAPGGGLSANVGEGYQVLFPIAEPATLSLVGLGLLAVYRARRRRNRVGRT